jgi:hypothetical protein
MALVGNGFGRTAKPLAGRQQEFLSWKFGMFIHFNVATFNERQWANGHPRSWFASSEKSANLSGMTVSLTKSVGISKRVGWHLLAAMIGLAYAPVQFPVNFPIIFTNGIDAVR